MYKDFEELRDNCPAEIKADIAIDFHHPELPRLDEIWAFTGDGEFRLSLIQKVTDFWERAVRARGGDSVPDDGLAMEILIDSYNDREMGYSMYLELHAYCGTEDIGELCWSVFEDEKLTVDFENSLVDEVPALLQKGIPDPDLRCEAELTEVREL